MSYFEGERASQTGTLVERTFPDTKTITPATTCCGVAGGKCTPDASLWSDPTWQALNFGLSDPHYYQYQYASAGSKTTSSFTAEANGDLDCDTVYSTFERVGSVDSKLNVVGGGGVFISNELQ